MRFILVTCVILAVASNCLAQDSLKAIGSISDRQKVYVLVIDGLKLGSQQNIVKALSSLKETEIEMSDTLHYEEAFEKYDSLIRGSDGAIELSVRIPIILNRILLQTQIEKTTHLSKVCDSSIVDITHVSRSKGKKITGKDPFNGCLIVVTSENNLNGR